MSTPTCINYQRNVVLEAKRDTTTYIHFSGVLVCDAVRVNVARHLLLVQGMCSRECCSARAATPYELTREKQGRVR